jgi:hypothetical protein
MKRRAGGVRRQLDREIDEASRVHRIQFRMPGGPWVYLASNGNGTMSLDVAHQFPSREAAETRAAAMQGPRSSLQARVVSTKAPSP